MCSEVKCDSPSASFSVCFTDNDLLVQETMFMPDSSTPDRYVFRPW